MNIHYTLNFIVLLNIVKRVLSFDRDSYPLLWKEFMARKQNYIVKLLGPDPQGLHERLGSAYRSCPAVLGHNLENPKLGFWPQM